MKFMMENLKIEPFFLYEVISCCVWVQYDNGASAASEGLKKMKEMILVANLTRSTETAVNFATQTFPSMDGGAEAITSPKRKKSRTGK